MPILFSRDDRSQISQWWWSIDRHLIYCVFLLMVIGLALVFTASAPVANRIGAGSMIFFSKHIFVLIPTIVIMLAISMLTLRRLRLVALIIFCVALIGVAMTYFVGAEIKGAKRWISLPGFSLQPSEFIKPAFALILADLLVLQRNGATIPGYLIGGIIAFITIILLVFQPDIGQTLLILTIFGMEVFLMGLPYMLVLGGIFLSVGGFIGAYFAFSHVQSRVNRFLDPASGDNYQVSQAGQAISNGGFFGVGPGEGQIKNHIPDSHADFIFAVAGEEFGMIFCMFIITIILYIIIRAAMRAIESENLFLLTATTGIITQFCVQSFVNIASSLNLIPTKGMTLPFISYGGSSMLAMGIAMGFLIALTRVRTDI